MADSKEHILDVAISGLKTEMWVKSGKPPMSELALKNWLDEKNLSSSQLIDIFSHRTPGLVESMQDINGDFWQELQARINFRVDREKQDAERIKKMADEPPIKNSPWKKALSALSAVLGKKEK